jgi:hypothetical protein
MDMHYRRSGDLSDEQWARRKGLIALLSAAADILVLAVDQLSENLGEPDEMEAIRVSIEYARDGVLRSLWRAGITCAEAAKRDAPRPSGPTEQDRDH